MRHRHTGRAHDGDGVGTRDAERGRVFRAIAGAGKPRRDRVLQNRQRALASFDGDGEAHPRSEARRPAVDHDHPLGREQRTVDERAVSRLLEIAGEQALEASDRSLAWTQQIDDPDVGRSDDRPGTQLIDDLGRDGVLLEDVAHKPASSAAE